MKKNLFILILVMIFSEAEAKWTMVKDGPLLSQYINQESIRKRANLARVWEMHDLKLRVNSDIDIKSLIFLNEYECQDERYRTISYSIQSERMGEGVALKTFNTPSEWNFIPPGDYHADYLKIVCQQ